MMPITRRADTEASASLCSSTIRATPNDGGGDSADWFFLAIAHCQLGNKDEALCSRSLSGSNLNQSSLPPRRCRLDRDEVPGEGPQAPLRNGYGTRCRSPAASAK